MVGIGDNRNLRRRAEIVPQASGPASGLSEWVERVGPASGGSEWVERGAIFKSIGSPLPRVEGEPKDSVLVFIIAANSCC